MHTGVSTLFCWHYVGWPLKITKIRSASKNMCLYPRCSSHSVTGIPVSGGIVVDSSFATQTLQTSGMLSALAPATLSDSDGVDGDSAGDIITYAITLNNTGTTTITSIKISSDMLLSQFER